MDSPETNRVIAFTSSPPALQVSPNFNYLTNLSPIRSVKAARYCRRFSQTNLPIPLPVFNSPRVDLQQRNSSLLSEVHRVAGSDVYRQSDIQLKPLLMPNFFQTEVQSYSSSGCIDQYLTDPIKWDNTMNSSTSGFTSHQEITAEADDTNAGNAKNTVSMSDQTREELPSVSMNFIEATVPERENERFREFLQCLSGNVDDNVESDIFGGPFFGAQHHELNSSQNIELQAAGGQHNKHGASIQLFPGSLQRDEAYKYCKASLGSLLEGSVKEADQRHRGIRRHLHFGSAIACKDTGNETHERANLCLPSSHTDFDTLVPPHVEPRGISGSWPARSCAQTATLWSSFCPSEREYVKSVQNHGNRSVSICIPSGGGLHLNSIVKSDSVDSDSSISKKLGVNLHQQEEKLMLVRDHYLGNKMDSIPVLSFCGEIYAHLGDEQKESQAAVGAGSSSYQSMSIMQPPCDSQHLIPFEKQPTQCAGTMLSSENSDMVDLNQMSPERDRKKAKYTIESRGCRRCNCKRSRCLKLYCECFAAGIYCLDSCSCENCFNKPEYEDTVLDMRQQIEARNPLAFAPKVVKQATNSPANITEEGSWTTPSSSRHKRGCNCKKSKCSKKYCECFQAGVGCCDGCRCEGCYNPYGKKTVAETIYRRSERRNNPSHEQQDTLESHSDYIKAERPNQFSSTWEELADVGHLTPPSHCFLGAVASPASLNVRDSSKILLGQPQQETSPFSSSSYLNWLHSPCSLAPKLYGSEALAELSSDSFFYNIFEDDTPETLKKTCTPSTKGLKSCSPNHKRVSPPQIRSNELRSSSSWGLRSGRKFILDDLPSFPPLTPYSKSQAGIHQNDGDHKGSNGYP